jgi:DNA-binding transcriptional LysR family regulator
MNIKDIDLNLLVFFDALMREKNVSRAAKTLEISQPALSNALSRLRKQLDDPLFIRASHGMRPTEKALQLHGPVQQALAQLHTALMPSQPFEPSKSKDHFTIASMDTIIYPMIARVITRLQTLAPDISLTLVPLSMGTPDMLDKGFIDFVIDAFVEGSLSQTFHKRKLIDDSLVCVYRVGHPLLTQHGELSMEAYLAYPHLRISRTGVGRGASDAFLKREGKQRFVQVESKQNALVPIYLVLESDLIATVPLSTAEDFAKHIPILISPSPLKLPSYEVEMMWGPIKHHNLGHQWLRQLIVDEANELH